MSLLKAKDLNLKICNKILLNNLNLSIAAGQVWGVLGRNGIGKTTLLHTLAGLDHTNHHKIYLNTIPLTKLARKKIAQQIGLLLQHDNYFFPNTVLATLLLGRYPHQTYWANYTASDMDLAKEVMQIMDISHLAYQQVTQLSGGEQRRVSLATLLAQCPDIYLLDEPTNQLDVNYAMQVMGHLYALAKNKNKAILLSIHDINIASRFCDQVLMIFENGHYLAGPTTKLLTTSNLEKLYQHRLVNIKTSQGHDYWLPS